MSENFRRHDAGDLMSDNTDSIAPPDKPPIPWLTLGWVAICSIIFVGLLLNPQDGTTESLSQWGYLPGSRIWGGGVWGLITSTFVHLEIWHFGFNVYWLWQLGRRLEDALGWWRYLSFFLLAALLSSAAQLLVSGTTGIGMSGVIYAMFGFMWIARHRFTFFKEILDDRTIAMLLIWLVGGIILTALEVMNIGNAAHITGCLFGVAVAYLYGLQGEPEYEEDPKPPTKLPSNNRTPLACRYLRWCILFGHASPIGEAINCWR
jgi:rhomboid protease GluP